MKSIYCTVATALLLAGVASGATIKELNDAFANKDYSTVISEADKTLAAENSTLSSSDMFGLIMLKAEALTRLGSYGPATREFDSAARISADMKQLAWARASALLLRRANGPTYTPRTGDKQPIDILDPVTRKTAFAAMLNDVLVDVKRRQQAALRATALPALEDAVVPVADACFLEIAATGEATEMLPLLRELGQHAQNLVAADLTRVQSQVSHLERVANMYDPTLTGTLRGTTSRERDQLRDLQGYLQRVNDRVRAYRDAVARVGGDTKPWDALTLEVINLQTDVANVLDTRY